MDNFGVAVKGASRTIFGDLSPDEVLNVTYKIQNYQEAALSELPHRGLSADYVARETRRALAGIGDKVKIWPGMDIDIPAAAEEKKTMPDDVRAAVPRPARRGRSWRAALAQVL